MAIDLAFSKMHGLGNDFVIVDAVNQRFVPTPEQVRRICERRYGVGCDQLLLVEPANDPAADFGYRIFNADGSEVEQCGNGARCFASFVRDKGLTEKEEIVARTCNGTIVLSILGDGNVGVDMGVPTLDPEAIPFVASKPAVLYPLALDDTELEVAAVAIGNPHLVLRVDDVDAAPVAILGRALEQHSRCPNGANVGFMQVMEASHIRLRVFERGVGETMACGSGACAAVVAGRLQNLLDPSVLVELRGGSLQVGWRGAGESVQMSGPAVHVFDGRLEL